MGWGGQILGVMLDCSVSANRTDRDRTIAFTTRVSITNYCHGVTDNWSHTKERFP